MDESETDHPTPTPPSAVPPVQSHHHHVNSSPRISAPLYTTDSGRLWHAGKILLAFVGLPARGKTQVSRSVERYLKWLGVKTEVFSLGDHRRRVLGPSATLPSDYFSPDERSEATEEMRRRVRLSLENDLEAFFKENRGQVAIYDANNGTRAARKAIRDKFEALGINVFFIGSSGPSCTSPSKHDLTRADPPSENICDRDDIVEANIRSVKISSPDYQGWDPDEAVKSYMSRIADHQRKYETLDNNTTSGPFVKIFNVGERLVINNVRGYLQSRIVFYLMNVHHKKRTIWFARVCLAYPPHFSPPPATDPILASCSQSGQSLIEHSYKADSDLSPKGVQYAVELKDFIIRKRKELHAERVKNGETTPERRLTLWTSARRRCLSTCAPLAELGYKVVERQQMYELNPGVIDSLTHEEIVEKYPEEVSQMQKDPYGHRFPRGESYHDLSVRLEPVILELEREPADVLLIAHASVIRCFLAYLQGLTPQEIPNVELRRGDVVQVTPSAYGVNMTVRYLLFIKIIRGTLTHVGLPFVSPDPFLLAVKDLQLFTLLA